MGGTGGRQVWRRVWTVGLLAAVVVFGSGCRFYSWGWNGVGQLGTGSTSTDPVRSPKLAGLGTTNWSSADAGNNHVCAIQSDNTLWCWGFNGNGNLGDATTTDRWVPRQITTSTWTQVSAGEFHTCAVRTTGTLWCWGYNGNGQLGDGTISDRRSPTQVGTSATWVSVSAGTAHTCGVRTDSTLWCWGDNTTGRLGDGTTTQRLSPTKIGTSTSWKSVTASTLHTCAVRTTGTLWCWGANTSGRLGDGTATTRLVPTQIGSATTWTSVSANTGPNSGHTCATRSDNTLWCWGFNGNGQLGDGTVTPRSVPTRVGTASTWTAVSTGEFHSCGLQSTGTIWCWGYNGSGQLGTGTTDRLSPVQVGTATDWQVVVAGGQSTLGLRNDAPTDSDGDRLPNSVETNTGVFVDTNNTGTNPNNPDTDGDGIDDGDETLGSPKGLPLPAMGTSPLKKNILLETDWFNDSVGCAAHSHRPTAASIASVTAAFAAGSTPNPDGTTGIRLIVDYGQGGVFSGGNQIVDADGVIAGGIINGSDQEFNVYKAANFNAGRSGYFHYILMPHSYNTNSTSSGQAELPGDDLIVSLGCSLSTSNVANTIMHELGHNLNRHHGGTSDQNYKPNYNSIMNYRYQFSGVDNNCTLAGDNVLDYSRGTWIALNETNLNENNGTCGAGFPIDWNGNGLIESSVSWDTNCFSDQTGCGLSTLLNDYDDWAGLSFSGLDEVDGASVVPQEVVTEQPVPPGYRTIPKLISPPPPPARTSSGGPESPPSPAGTAKKAP